MVLVLKESNDKEIIFKGTIIRQMYDGGDYKIYAVDVNKDIYQDIKFSKYGNAVINGEIHELGVGIEYEIKAKEQLTKHGYSYKVINIRRNKPASFTDMYLFLEEILTENQARTLYEAYPNIVEKVMNDDLSDIDFDKLYGIKEYTFQRIKNKIVENFALAELVIEFQGLLSLPMLKKLYDKYTSVRMIKNKLRENPYKCLCGLARVGFLTADSILLELERGSKENVQNGKPPIIDFDEDLKTSHQRCLSCILYLLEKNEEDGHTWMNIAELKKQCDKLAPACSNHFNSCMGHESICVYSLVCVARRSTYNTEKYIADKIKSAIVDQNIKWDFDCDKYRIVHNCELSDEQMQILKNICNYNVCILNGFAGSGKSFSTQAIISMLVDNQKSFELFSPTGKAAKILSDYTGRKASTIHRGLGYIPPDNWTYNEDYKLNCDVLIIDEFSMTDIFLFKKVLEAIDFSKTKLLLIGDNAQLPSVSCGNILHDFMQSGIIPTVTLTKIFRYGEGGLMKIATDVRNCKEYLSEVTEAFTWFGANKDYGFLNVHKDYTVKSAMALYSKLLKQGYSVDEIQVLTSYKKGDMGSISLNNAIQKIANPNYGDNDYMKIGETVYFKGDIVIQNVNNYKAQTFKEDFFDEGEDEPGETFVANGETGVILEIYQNYAIIDFDGVVVKYTRNDMQMIGLGYCITIHKSQGSSIKVVILITPASHTYMLNSNLIYVGLTRMKEKCIHLGTIGTVNTAVKKKANFERNTMLQKLLRETE